MNVSRVPAESTTRTPSSPTPVTTSQWPSGKVPLVMSTRTGWPAAVAARRCS